MVKELKNPNCISMWEDLKTESEKVQEFFMKEHHFIRHFGKMEQ